MNGARRAGERLLGGLYVDPFRDHRRSVFLAGSGRSGTTWVSEIINHRRAFRYVFEPFHPGKVGICRRFASKQYLRPGDARAEYLDPARRVLTGAVRSAWTDRFNRKRLVRRRLIKDIRANLLLGWMREHFPGMPMVLLLRHPCAVVASRLALGWRDNLNETMAQAGLVEDFLGPVEAEIRAAKTPFERHLFLWCIDNYVPLRQLAPSDLHLLFYEELVARPEEVLPPLFAFLGTGFDEGVYGDMGRPSVLSRPGSPTSAGPSASPRSLDGWREHVGAPQRRRAAEILGLFGLDRVYGAEDVMPAAAEALMRPRAGKEQSWKSRR